MTWAELSDRNDVLHSTLEAFQEVCVVLECGERANDHPVGSDRYCNWMPIRKFSADPENITLC
ncbi:hypothetical protein ASC75_19190 [Aminobacter sp. DSM 101952]|nr:hypothetical protein ASC75_19190 [Aminobacter sp. DSM 101952]